MCNLPRIARYLDIEGVEGLVDAPRRHVLVDRLRHRGLRLRGAQSLRARLAFFEVVVQHALQIVGRLVQREVEPR